jgi:hypothetical protein
VEAPERLGSRGGNEVILADDCMYGGGDDHQVGNQSSTQQGKSFKIRSIHEFKLITAKGFAGNPCEIVATNLV